VGAEKAELPQDDIDESEKDEQTEFARSKVGLLLLIISHSSAGLSSWLKAGYSLGAGVVGGVSVREYIVDIGMGDRKSADVEWEKVGLDICEGASDISMVGITVESSWCRWNCALGRFLLTLNGWARGGGGGSAVD
jgi:hypothetical protein